MLGFSTNGSKLASGSTVLEEMPPSVKKYTANTLRDLKVDTRYKTKILNSTPTPDGRQELTLSTGGKLIADMYIPTFGLIPNSSYIPSKYLNAKGYAVVNEYLQIEGAKDVWAIGDVSAIEPEQLIVVDKQSAHLAKNIVAILSNKTPIPYKKATSRKLSLQMHKWLWPTDLF